MAQKKNNKFTLLWCGLIGVLCGIMGILIGQIKMRPIESYNAAKEIFPVLTLTKRAEDMLHAESNVPMRIVWSGEHITEGAHHTIPLSQVPTESDIVLQEYEWVGNTETMKYYSTESYYGRGIAVQHRRFFKDHTSAQEAGYKQGG